jgi:hypothetical protein
MDIGSAHSFMVSIFSSLRIPLPCIPAAAPMPERRTALSVITVGAEQAGQANAEGSAGAEQPGLAGA